MKSNGENEEGASNLVGNILMVVIGIILAALLLSLLLQFPTLMDQSIPTIFQISKIRHVNDAGRLTYDSRVMLINKDTTGYKNRNLMAKIYRNGIPLPFTIATFNGHDYIAYAHTAGVDTMGGPGCSGDTWDPGELTYIDFNDNTFHPDDVVQIDVYDNSTRQIISRDIFPHTNNHDMNWFVRVVINHQAA